MIIEVRDPKTGRLHVAITGNSAEDCKRKVGRLFRFWIQKASCVDGGGLAQLRTFQSWFYTIDDGGKCPLEEGSADLIPIPSEDEP